MNGWWIPIFIPLLFSLPSADSSTTTTRQLLVSEAVVVQNACAFTANKCLPSSVRILSMNPPSSEADRVIAKTSAHGIACAQHNTSAKCTADAANFCVFDASKTNKCDVDYTKAFSTTKCAATLDSGDTSFFSVACSAHFFLQDYCSGIDRACNASGSLCTTSNGKCVIDPALGSSALLAYAAETGTLLATDIQAAMFNCSKASSADSCANISSPITIQASIVDRYRTLNISQLPGNTSADADVLLGNATRDLGYIVSDNGTVIMAVPLPKEVPKAITNTTNTTAAANYVSTDPSPAESASSRAMINSSISTSTDSTSSRSNDATASSGLPSAISVAVTLMMLASVVFY